MKSTLWLSAVLVVSPGLASAVEGVPYTVYGAGTVSCGKYLELRRANDRGQEFQVLAWADGFISGHNRNTLVADQVRGKIDDETILAYLDKYCRDNPLHDLVKGVVSLVDELTPASGSARR